MSVLCSTSASRIFTATGPPSSARRRGPGRGRAQARRGRRGDPEPVEQRLGLVFVVRPGDDGPPRPRATGAPRRAVTGRGRRRAGRSTAAATPRGAGEPPAIAEVEQAARRDRADGPPIAAEAEDHGHRRAAAVPRGRPGRSTRVGFVPARIRDQVDARVGGDRAEHLGEARPGPPGVDRVGLVGQRGQQAGERCWVAAVSSGTRTRRAAEPVERAAVPGLPAPVTTPTAGRAAGGSRAADRAATASTSSSSSSTRTAPAWRSAARVIRHEVASAPVCECAKSATSGRPTTSATTGLRFARRRDRGHRAGPSARTPRAGRRRGSARVVGQVVAGRPAWTRRRRCPARPRGYTQPGLGEQEGQGVVDPAAGRDDGDPAGRDLAAPGTKLAREPACRARGSRRCWVRAAGCRCRQRRRPGRAGRRRPRCPPRRSRRRRPRAARARPRAASASTRAGRQPGRRTRPGPPGRRSAAGGARTACIGSASAALTRARHRPGKPAASGAAPRRACSGPGRPRRRRSARGGTARAGRAAVAVASCAGGTGHASAAVGTPTRSARPDSTAVTARSRVGSSSAASGSTSKAGSPWWSRACSHRSIRVKECRRARRRARAACPAGESPSRGGGAGQALLVCGGAPGGSPTAAGRGVCRRGSDVRRRRGGGHPPPPEPSGTARRRPSVAREGGLERLGAVDAIAKPGGWRRRSPGRAARGGRR